MYHAHPWSSGQSFSTQLRVINNSPDGGYKHIKTNWFRLHNAAALV